MIDAKTIIERIRAKHNLPDSTEVGVAAAYGKDLNFAEDRRELTVIINTFDIDIEDEVVLPKGLNFDYILKSKSIYVDHVYDMEHLIGKLRRIDPVIRNNALTAWRAGIVIPKLNNHLAEDTLTLTKEGGMGVSIGFIPLDRSRPTNDEIKAYGKGLKFSSIVRAAKVLEVSLTGMPANIACGTNSIYLDGSKRAVIDDLIAKGRISPKGIEAFNLSKQRSLYEGKRIVVEI